MLSGKKHVDITLHASPVVLKHPLVTMNISLDNLELEIKFSFNLNRLSVLPKTYYSMYNTNRDIADRRSAFIYRAKYDENEI